MEELTKGEIKRRQKCAEWYANVIKDLSDCGVEARLIEKDDPKYLKKIEDWRHIVLVWRQKFGARISEVHRLGNDVLRSWCYGGVFGDSLYGQGLIGKAKTDFNRLANISSFTEFDKVFKEMFSQKPVDRLMEKYKTKAIHFLRFVRRYTQQLERRGRRKVCKKNLRV